MFGFWCLHRLHDALAPHVDNDYDNALAETINSLYKAELIHRRAPWKTVESLELPTSNG